MGEPHIVTIHEIREAASMRNGAATAAAPLHPNLRGMQAMAAMVVTAD